MKRIPLVCIGCCIMLAALIPCLDGCGAGRVQQIGRAAVIIIWPDPSRLIPAASNSIRIDVKNGTLAVATRLVPRPSTPGPATVLFDALPVGDFTVSAAAYPQADGTGTAQATASVPLTIAAGQQTSFSLTLGSTIDHLEVAPSNVNIMSRGQIALSAVAKDASGSVILTAPSKIQWGSSNLNAVTVDSSGAVTANDIGLSTITVTDTESGKKGQASINVPQPAGWWRAEGNTVDSALGNGGTIFGGVSYCPGAFGQAFLFNGLDGEVAIPDAVALKITQSLAVDAHIWLDSLPSQSQGEAMVVFRGDSRGGLDPYYMAVVWTGNLRFHVESTTAYQDIEAPIPVRQWVHVTGTLDDATGTMRLYIEGNQVAQATTSVRPLANLDPTKNPGVGIGNHAGFPTLVYHYPFHGAIDEVRIYNVAALPGN